MWYPTQCWFWRPIISPDSTWPAMFQVVQFMTTTQCLGCGSCTCVWIFCAASKVLNKSQSIPKALFVLLILFWLVVWNMAFVFHNLIYGMLSFPLTFIFFKMIIAPPTSYDLILFGTKNYLVFHKNDCNILQPKKRMWTSQDQMGCNDAHHTQVCR